MTKKEYDLPPNTIIDVDFIKNGKKKKMQTTKSLFDVWIKNYPKTNVLNVQIKINFSN